MAGGSALVAAPLQPLGPNDRMLVICDVGGLHSPDLDAIDAVARLALAARRLGCGVRLENASPELHDLVAFVGLDDVVSCVKASTVESRRKPEQREVTGGVEEEGDPGDPVA
jgi:hypothetical protein